MELEHIQKLYNEKKYDEVKLLLKDELDSDNPIIQYLLGMIANEEKDYKKAFIHFLRASELGHSEAERVLGIYYYQGYGINKEETKGFYYVNKAIKDGNVRALCTLAHIYMHGIGVNKDEHQAFKLYEEAMAKGDEHAKEHVIECYTLGIGVAKDYQKAKELKNQG